jgi:hypothetical protein
MGPVATVLFHVSSSLNRASIAEHGLDSRRMGGTPGIAGSRVAELDGIFLALDPEESDWFVWMGKPRHPSLDVWEVTLDQDFEPYQVHTRSDLPCELINGHLCWMEPIPPAQLRLLERDR